MTSVLLAVSDAALYAIPLAATIISLAALIVTAVGYRGAADAKHVDELERRLEVCEEDRRQLRVQVEQMGAREIQLMRQIVQLQERSP